MDGQDESAKHPLVQLCDRLFIDLLVADAFRKIYEGLWQELHVRTISQIAPTYFALSVKAFFEMSYITLARLYDKTKGTVQLRSLVELAETKAGQFQTAKPAEARKMVAEARKYIADAEPLFEPIEKLRHKVLAHLDKRTIEELAELSKELDLSAETFGKLVAAGRACINSIRAGFDGVVSAEDFVGQDDYEQVFYLSREVKKAQIRSYEQEFGEWPERYMKEDLGL